MKTIYESDEIVVVQENTTTYHMQINNQDKVANDANTLSSAISAIKNAVWALDIYSNKKIQLVITLIGSTPNAVIMQNTQNNSQLKNFTVLNLDIIINYSLAKLAPKIFQKAIISAGIGATLGTMVPGIGNAVGAGSGFIAGAGRVVFLAGVGYFSTTILSNIYDTLEIDALYDYLKENIFSLKDKYEQDTLRNPNEMELMAVLESLDSSPNALDIDSLLHTFPHYLAHTNATHSVVKSTSSLSLSNSPDSIPMYIKAKCLNHKNEPLTNREIYVYSPNFTSFVDRAKSDDNGYITFNNAYVSSKMTNSDLYFVLNRYGLDEEQKEYHIKISPSKTIQPKDKKTRELINQTLVFNKHIPKAIKANDSITPNIKVNAIEFIEQNSSSGTTRQKSQKLSMKQKSLPSKDLARIIAKPTGTSTISLQVSHLMNEEINMDFLRKNIA